MIPTKDDRFAAADEIIADLNTAYLWGQKWNIIFAPDKCYSLCVSLKKDVDLHLLLYMNALSIAEVDASKVLGIHFDRKLTWNHMINQLATCSHHRLGAIYRAKDYLGKGGLTIAFKSFVRPVCEYCNIIFMDASATHLHKLDLFQKMAERMCNTTFSSLASRQNASSIGLLCKLLDLLC